MTIERTTKFDADYPNWKNWGTTETFGKLKPHHRAYFSAEIKRTQLAHINKVLEIGFGNGHFLTYAREKGWNITGTEINEGQVKVARELGFNVIFAHDLNHLNQEEFDLIVAFDVLEHVQQEDLPEFLATVRRLLRRDGIFLARFPNGDSPFGLETQYGDITHVTVIGRGKIEYFSKQAGFHIVYFGGEAQPILCGSMKHLFHRMASVPIKTILEFVTILLFLPRSRITFYAPNITVALQKSTSFERAGRGA